MNSTQSAIPLVLPNNCTWDKQTGYHKKPDVERTALEVIPKALDQLREIKGPVCVVSIAGPCRKGKSYILSKAFDQEEVFPLGHEMDPETMGIWLWVVPQKFQDSTGRDFTVVLLDSEGVDSVYAKQSDDHRIFTLSVLLSSILIYNSDGVPKRSDLDGLDFIVKLSERIKMHTKQYDADKDESRHFFKVFPIFVWLFRDVTLALPQPYTNAKDYLLERVLSEKSDEGSSETSKKTADSILNFFSGFDAFLLPSPAYDPEVLKNLDAPESTVNPKFLEGIEKFKALLKPKLAPKKSIMEEELMTGKALAAMVQLFVEALNTPGVVPNVQNAWDTFVHTKCTEVLAAALTTYKQEMTSQLQGKIPCEADVIRAAHDKAVKNGLAKFQSETLDLSTKSVDKYLEKIINGAKPTLEDWIMKNKGSTEAYCRNLLKGLKEDIVNPVLARLRGPEAAKIKFKELEDTYNEIEKRYKLDARGAKDLQATVFKNFISELREEMKQYADVLQRMKDYDDEVEREKAQKVLVEEQKRRQEEFMAGLEQEKRNMEKQFEVLKERQKEEIKRIEQGEKQNMRKQKEQMDNFIKASNEAGRKERERAIQEQATLKQKVNALQNILDQRGQEIIYIEEEIEEKSKPGVLDIIIPIGATILGVAAAAASPVVAPFVGAATAVASAITSRCSVM